MNTQTGEVRLLDELGERDLATGEWVRVSDELAEAAEIVGLQEQVVKLLRERD